MAESETQLLKLIVAEALPNDVGVGMARMDPKDMSDVGVQSGDVVRVVGRRATATKVEPINTKDRGKGLVQIDGIIRKNAHVSLGEQVEIQAPPSEDAGTVILAPSGPSNVFVPERDTGYLARVLQGLPLTRGDMVRATLFGTRHQEFSVLETDPKGIVIVGLHTIVEVRGKDATSKEEKDGTTYEDIGALHKEVQRIRELVELPIQYPELFARLGIEAPKGVLLHGPPGCGKTLIARAVANETDSAFFHVSGPEVFHKYYGESEAHLRAVFNEASEQAPAIIFIDEVDAIASKREMARDDQQIERRVVAQLLALMDGLKSRGQVVVIGATNIPQVLDPALRRPGRFDRELAISVPDRNGRLEILQIHTRGMPLSSNVSLEKLAEITHGYVGADLEALCREAAMSTLRKIIPQIYLAPDQFPYESLSELEITMEDFLEAIKEIEPSAIREVFTEVPEVNWDDVGGLEDVKQVLVESIEWPFKYPSVFRQTNTRPPRGILFSGPPGTGKTFLAKAVASQCEVNFISIKGPALLSRWMGEAERAVQEVFKKAKQASPCIVFFDEIDSLTPVRGAGDGSQVTERVVSQLLAELDGLEDLQGVIVLAATNRLDLVDPAILRPGRFDLQLELPLPDEKARREIFSVHTRGRPLAPDVDLDSLAQVTDGMVGSDIEAVCRQASMLAIREFVNDNTSVPTPSELDALMITAGHFERAIRHMGRQAE